MITVQKSHISMLLLADFYCEKHKTEEKLKFFRKKYNTNFHSFEQYVHESDENFQSYDDYMEWKAYENHLLDINRKIVELKSGHFQVA